MCLPLDLASVAYSLQFCIILPNQAKGPFSGPLAFELPESHCGPGGLQGSVTSIRGFLLSQHFPILFLKS
jgi:hypothetical protein